MSFAFATYVLMAAAMLVATATPSDLPTPGISRRQTIFDNAINITSYATVVPAIAAQSDQDQTSVPFNPYAEVHEDLSGAAILPHADDYLAFEITETQTLVQRRGDIAKRQIQRPAYRGKCKMRCKENPQACQNACYYQNCIRNPSQGPIYYYEPGPNSASRQAVGVTVRYGTPCRTWPFGQKFWDPRARTAAPDIINLQCDEWPMNSMHRDPFVPLAAVPQVALRCMPNADNSRGATHVTYFRRRQAEWSTGGEFETERLGNNRPFIPGDWYEVEFLLDNFNLNDPAELAIFNTIGYCKPNPDCRNDGLQFRTTNVRSGSIPSVKEGKFYDNALHNTYRMTGQPADIQQFHIWLKITGQNNDQVEARVHVFSNGVETVLTRRRPSPMARNSYFELSPSGVQRQNIRVHRDALNCMLFTFTYGYPISTTQPWKSFTFKSNDGGWAEWSPTNGNYCVREDISSKKPGQSVTILKCTFPGW